MTIKTLSPRADNLRQRAEKMLKMEEEASLHESLTPEQMQQMLYELRAHQIELEMQNEELHRIQHELEISRARYFDLYDLAPVGYLTLNEQGLILKANLAAVNMLGADRNMLHKQPLFRYILPDDQDIFCLHCKQLLKTGEPQTSEFRMLQMDGAQFWARMDTSPCQSKDASHLVWRAVLSDISKQKASEEALRVSEARYLSIIEDQTELICRYLPDGRLSFVNGAYVRYYEKGQAELINTNFIPNIPEPDLSMVLNRLAGISPKTPVAAFTHRIINADGEVRWQRWTQRGIYAADGGLLECQAVGFDITEHKLAEMIMQARLRINEYLFGHSLEELLTKVLDEAETLTDSQIGFFHFLDVDQVTLSLQTWSSRTLATVCTAEGKGHRYPVERAGVWCDCIREKRPVIHNNYELLPHRKGVPIGHAPVLRQLVVPIFRNSLIVAVLGVGNKYSDYTSQDIETIQQLANLSWDIVERKQAELALKQLHDELETKVAERTSALALANEQMQKVSIEMVWAEERERGRIAGELHDQVGQSLLLAKMKLDALADRISSDSLLTYAEEASSLLGNSIHDIRSLTFRMRPPILETAGIETALEWLCSSISNDYTFQIDFTNDCQPKPLPAEVRYSLYQAVRKLLLNIVKHAKSEKAQLSGKTDNHTLVVHVLDNGVGFEYPDAHLQHVKNGGYGLYNVQQRVEQMGGRFAIESAPGCGTSVTLIVPFTES